MKNLNKYRIIQYYYENIIFSVPLNTNFIQTFPVLASHFYSFHNKIVFLYS